VMHGPSLKTFVNRMSPGGLLLLNADVVSDRPSRGDVEVVAVPAVQLAEEIGSGRSANMIMLGALVGHYGLVAQDSVHKALERLFEGKKKLITLNAQAFDRGCAYAAETKRKA
ncbi:MAG: 2-oxoacid:acceptor oxidoreductase family protein, partial [Deltaproteobacteria bacterium]|nr:2-oxoacid:acceptor oxidoreductase family protein [Deltaproteobacteria bacterium]